MQIRESPLTVPESLDLRGGPAGWQSPVNGCLQVPQCRTLKFPGCGAQPPVWSRPLLPAIERTLNPLRSAFLGLQRKYSQDGSEHFRPAILS